MLSELKPCRFCGEKVGRLEKKETKKGTFWITYCPNEHIGVEWMEGKPQEPQEPQEPQRDWAKALDERNIPQTYGSLEVRLAVNKLSEQAHVASDLARPDWPELARRNLSSALAILETTCRRESESDPKLKTPLSDHLERVQRAYLDGSDTYICPTCLKGGVGILHDCQPFFS